VLRLELSLDRRVMSECGERLTNALPGLPEGVAESGGDGLRPLVDQGEDVGGGGELVVPVLLRGGVVGGLLGNLLLRLDVGLALRQRRAGMRL
jgi:hypothetical protein